MLAQRANAFGGSVVLAEQGIDLLDSPADPLLDERQKNIFFAFEVRVESSARIACRRRDILQARCFKPFPREYSLGRFQQFPACGFGSRSLLRGGRTFPLWIRIVAGAGFMLST